MEKYKADHALSIWNPSVIFFFFFLSFSAKTDWDRVAFHLMDKEGGLQFSSSPTTPYCLPNNKARCGLPYHCDCAFVFLIPAPSFTCDASQAVVFYDDRLT